MLSERINFSLLHEEFPMKRLTIAMITLLMAGSMPALAGQGQRHGQGPRSFGTLDANGDKSLSKDEVASAPRLSANFESIDADKNGSISEEELQAYRDARCAGRMKK
jgi:hypothetical protein